MGYQHKELAKGRWAKMSFLEKMANIGSEVERTIAWKEKGDEDYSRQAFWRSIELFNLTLQTESKYSRLKEVARAREIWTDFAMYDNEYNSTKESWRNYFMQFLMAYKQKQPRKSKASV